MEQMTLWHESPEEALEADVQAAGGPKRVAAALWPARSPAEAARLLRRCLDPERQEKLGLDEVTHVVALAAEHGSRALLEYLARRARARVTPVTPEDEKAELLERWEAARREVAALARMMEGVR